MTRVRATFDHRKVLSSTMQRITLAVLALMSTALVACSDGTLAGGMPVGPTSLGTASTASTAFSGLDESHLPAIVVHDGISCPSDAPLVMVGSKDTRLDIEWSPIPRVEGYQVSIEAFGVTNDWQVVRTIETTRVRAEWSGMEGGIYRVRVRSRVCGGFGLWSAYATQGLTDPHRSVPVPTKPVEPECPTVSNGPVGDYRTRTSMPDDACPPPCQTQVYAPTTSQPSVPCMPPCEGLAYDSASLPAPAPAPCAPPCELPEYWDDSRVRTKFLEIPEECYWYYFPAARK